MTTFREMINNVEYNEFIDKFYEEATKEEMETMTWCNRCPFKEECGKADLFYGCGVWEEYMGEDL